MFSEIKVKNHKGVRSIHLNSLGKINILFGKNNSGKTSIVEGINKKDCVAVGKALDDVSGLINHFSVDAGKYFDNIARKATAAFQNYLEGLKSAGTIWYYGEEDQIIDQCAKDLSSDKDLKNIKNMFEMQEILSRWFEDVAANFKSILIPPKRKLESSVEINLDQEIEPYGGGVVNHLFYLKNQSPSTEEYKLFKRIFEAFSEISDYEFDIVPDLKNNIQIIFKRFEEEVWIPAEDSGLGLADLLTMITFAIGTNHSIICLEEPESHLHPEMQKRFLTFLKGVENKQFILSTHSYIFLNPSVVDRIFYVQYTGSEVQVTDETENAKVLFNLGYSISDHLIADAIVIVEQPSDIPVIGRVLHWAGLNRRFNINYFPLSGDVRAYLDLGIFSRRQNVIALTFSREENEVATSRFYKNCEKMGIKVWRLERASIENYFSLPALRKVFGDKIPADITRLEPHISVDAQIGFSLEHKSVKTHNSEIIHAMSEEEVEGTDLYDFCHQVKKVLQDKPDIEYHPVDPSEHELIRMT
ncbi:MAG: ATP-binding protein [Spirochaetales bacterium]|nr:ATP-binding protein [Spirochaetales bacterium]